MKNQRENLVLKDSSTVKKEYVETREDYLLKGRNGLESAVIISDQLGNAWGGPKLMEWDKVKFILKTLNENKIKYAIIGGIAMGQHALPRTTHDLDILVATNDLERVRKLFEKYYKEETRVVQIYDIEGTRLDVLPAKLRHRVIALDDAIDSNLEEILTKVVSVRDLVILKLLAAADRKELVKQRQDETDVTALLEYGKGSTTKGDIKFIAESVLAMVYTKEDVQKFRAVIRWLNDTLDQLEMESLKYPLD